MRCDPSSLDRLVRHSDDEQSAEFMAAIEHLETCERCRLRLAEMCQSDGVVAEACETLRVLGETSLDEGDASPSVVVAVESLLSDDNPVDCDVVSLDFLEPPGHPELLGRIGRYDIERLVGAGGMGIVLKGFDTELHRVVAIKVLAPHLATSGAARRRFAREAQAAAAVVHEHVIPIYNVETEGDLPYLVMQFVPGKSLQARVDEHGPLEVKDVLRIARQAAAGLGAAHAQGLVHRDVKPANILLEESVDRVLLSDFGLARTADDATLTRTGILTGTPHYMSPEQAEGKSVDRRSDLFSLGSVLYFMCTGRPPFRADSPMAVLHRICHEPHRPVDAINPDVPLELADIIDRLLAKNPAARFAGAREVESRSANLLAQLQQGSRLRRRPWLRRLPLDRALVRRSVVGTIAALICVLMGAGLSWIWAPRASEHQDVVNVPATNPAPLPKPVTAGRRSELPPDTFAADLLETRERLEAIEAKRDAIQTPARDTDDALWQKNLAAVRSMLESRESSPQNPTQTSIPTDSRPLNHKD